MGKFTRATTTTEQQTHTLPPHFKVGHTPPPTSDKYIHLESGDPVHAALCVLHHTTFSYLSDVHGALSMLSNDSQSIIVGVAMILVLE